MRLEYFVTVLLLIVISKPGSAQIDFDTSRAIPAGGFDPLSIASDDFNLDGCPDLVFGIEFNTAVSVSLGNGMGNFSPPEIFDAAKVPQALTTGDFNEDGFPDLAAVTGFDNSLVIWLGDGTGQLSAPQVHPQSFVLGRDIATADLNEDGHLDLAVARANALGKASLIFGDGFGNFTNLRNFDAGDTPIGLVIGDFDEDNHLDLMVANSESSDIAFLAGTGTTSFLPSVSTVLNQSPVEIVSGDFNEDTHLDVAVVTDRNTIIVLLGDGAGGLTPQPRINAGNFPPRGLIASDLSGDGHLDLAMLDELGIETFLGDGTGGFAFLERLLVLGDSPMGPKAQELITSDFDRDGSPDLASVQTISMEGAVLLNRGSGRFPQPPRFDPEGGSDAVAAGDLNNDGRMDIVSSNPSSVTAFLGDGTGEFFRLPSVFAGSDSRHIQLADFNEDQKLDAVVGNSGRDELSVLLGNGNGTFRPRIVIPTGNNPRAVCVGDFDEDGHQDLAAIDDDKTGHLRIHFGDGTGSFPSSTIYNTDRDPLDIICADFDGDGHLDVATANRSRQSVTVIFLDGTRNPVEGQNYSTFASSLIDADLNGDGLLDLVVRGSDELRVLLQGPARSFTSAQVLTTPCGFTGLTAPLLVSADFDEDGHTDVGLAVRCSGVLLLRGDGSGQLTRVGIFRSGNSGAGIAAADYDEDGHLDLAVAGEVAILRNRAFDVDVCRRGNVNAAEGPLADVLFINDSPGIGPERKLTVGIDDPIAICIERPPSKLTGRSAYVMYFWRVNPTSIEDVKPFALGRMCLPFPPFPGCTPQPAAIVNAIGFIDPLGATSNWPGRDPERAPHRLIHLPNGTGFPIDVFLQGIILDTRSLDGRAAITNGVLLSIE